MTYELEQLAGIAFFCSVSLLLFCGFASLLLVVFDLLVEEED